LRKVLEKPTSTREIQVSVFARVYRRSLRVPWSRRALYRGYSVRSSLPILRKQGGVGSPCQSMVPHLRFASSHHQLLQQLRTLPVP
jgi:hypothetical protein